ncbi:MAG TPA: histidine ammonia-lyase [Woeseiaceae bacterium]|nr:histidine ammonia-lyase [Woeseiaceae bacterium]
MNNPRLQLRPGHLSLSDLRKANREPVSVSLNRETWQRIRACRQVVDDVIANGDVAYGINTGFGRLAQTTIDIGNLAKLQENLLLSHAAGVGQPMQDRVIRLAMLLKLNSLARGYSGVSCEVVELLAGMLNNRIYPVVPGKGSVGASGDLAPLAHLSLPLIGLGHVRVDDRIQDSVTALQQVGLQPISLRAKDGLSLLNGTQISTALALSALFDAEMNADAAFIAGSMTVEATLGSRSPFDAGISEIRGLHGQIEAARIFRLILDVSELGHSHQACDRVQDPYSLRCQPQVMGACLDQLRHAAGILEIESNAVSDNPLVFPDRKVILSGGNFHAESVAMVSDNIALAVAEMAALSERRLALLIDSHLSQLPPFLVADAGLNSGFMIAQVTAAALASENKSLAHPACVDSLPTSANQEDHVSMATFAARRLFDMNENSSYIIGIELLAAAQGLDFRRPLRSSDTIESAHATIRSVVPTWDRDRLMHSDIEAAFRLIKDGAFDSSVSHYIDAR